MQSWKISFALAAACATLAFPQAIQNKVEERVHRGAQAAREQTAREQTSSLRRMERPVREYSLGRLRSSESRPVRRKPGLTPIGVSRAVPADLEQSGEWSATSEGSRAWRLSVRSEGASAIRIRFTEFHVGSGKVWLLGTDEDGVAINAGPYSGDGPNGDGTFWSDMIASESAVIAYEPASGSAGAVPFTIAEISHRFAPIVSATPKAADASRSAAASCTVDSTCRPEYTDAASAVALIVFESGGESYQCSGALIGSASQPVLPFFMTANHCIANADEARSVIAFFNYQTATCNGTRPTLSRAVRVTGSTFVTGGDVSLGDYSLLQLSAFPAMDVKLLGWTSEDIASNQQVTSISHPTGDYKRIALGERGRDASVRYSDGTRMPANRGYQVSWFEGVTQGGSSGSPLLAFLGGKQYFVGVLSGGPDIDEEDDAVVCRANNLIASYGRFTAAFPDVQRYLTASDGGGRPPSSTAPSLTATNLNTSSGPGSISVSWLAPGFAQVQIRVGSPDGVPMTGIESSSGSVQTGPWAVEGMVFYLQDASTGNSAGAAKTLATARVERAGSSPQRSGTIALSPNPATAIAGQTAITATVTWRATGVSRVQVRVGSPVGPPLTGLEQAVGSGTTGNWVVDGTLFYLQDASDGDSSGASKTLAFVRAQVVVR